jgi:hypothetical protein
LLRSGPDRRRIPQVVDDIGFAQRLGEEGVQQAEGLALDGRLRRPGPGVPELSFAVVVAGGEPLVVGAGVTDD